MSETEIKTKKGGQGYGDGDEITRLGNRVEISTQLLMYDLID